MNAPPLNRIQLKNNVLHLRNSKLAIDWDLNGLLTSAWHLLELSNSQPLRFATILFTAWLRFVRTIYFPIRRMVCVCVCVCVSVFVQLLDTYVYAHCSMGGWFIHFKMFSRCSNKSLLWVSLSLTFASQRFRSQFNIRLNIINNTLIFKHYTQFDRHIRFAVWKDKWNEQHLLTNTCTDIQPDKDKPVDRNTACNQKCKQIDWNEGKKKERKNKRKRRRKKKTFEILSRRISN